MKTYQDLFVALQHLPDDQHISEWFLNDRWRGKDKQESVFRLTARFGLIDKLQDFIMCNGNFNRRTIRPMTSYRDIFFDTKNQEICLKDKGDSSDLTGIHKSDPRHLLVSTSKCIRRLTLHNLDIDSIMMNFQQYPGYHMTLCIIVKDCEQFHCALKRSEKTSQYLRHIIDKHHTIIIDWNDLDRAYQRFRSIYCGKFVDQLIDKKPLMLRPHQRLCCRKTMQLKEVTSKILWGHIQRSGKSYMMAGVIIDDSLNKSNCNYLVMTTAPKETMEQYIHVFDCVQLADFNIIHIEGKNHNRVVLGEKNIILCSKQFLQNKVVHKISWLSNMRFDFRFLDETHHGGTTELAKKVLLNYGADACTVYITATYSKPVHDYAIPREHWILWDMEDIRLCKTGDTKSLIKKHGDHVSELWCGVDGNFHTYPDLEILTMHPRVVVSDDVYGWSIESCFLLTQGVDADGKIMYQPRFQNRNENLKLWYTLFGKRDRFGIPDPSFPDDLVFMKRIDKISKNPVTHTRSIDEMVSTVIMVFLPSDHIDLVSQATRDLLVTENVIPQYDIVCINSRTTSDPKQSIMDAKTTARNHHKKGIVVLSARQCSMGVSIDDCDVVVLMNNTRSYDLVFQMMFRCMTEGEGKNRGFVVDFNAHRAMDMIMMDYSSMTRKNPKETVRYLLQERLLCLNSDHWMACFGNGPDVFTDFTQNISSLFSSQLSRRFDHFFERMVVKPYILSSIENHDALQLLFHRKNRRLLFSDDDDSVKPGMEKKRIESLTKKNTDDKSQNVFSYILRPLSVLLSLLTIDHDELDETKRRILMGQVGVWCKKTVSEDELSHLLCIYREYIEKDHDIKRLVVFMKQLILDNLSNPHELLIIIEKYMIPLDSERVVFAEVSTPPDLRRKMLDTIPHEFWTKRDRRVWDPCCGKGGFVLDIVSRFMNGLQNEIPDRQERYRFIIEECVYFSDINERNVYITKLLLLGNKGYSVHAQIGDSLQLDIRKDWGLEGFDAVIANPPYNATNTLGTGNTIWQHFVRKALQDWTLTGSGKYIVMVHPSGWRKPNTLKCRFTGLYTEMVKRNHIRRLSIHGIKDGYRTFKSGTRYDWYVLERIPSEGKKTEVRDEMGNEVMIDLEKWEWLPNYAYNEIRQWIVCDDDRRCPIMYSRNAYGSDGKHVSKKEDACFKYPCVHTTTSKNGVRFMYSNVRDRGMFGVPKVIFGQTGYQNALIDADGRYGMTEHAMAIPIEGKEDGENLIAFLRSDRFRNAMNACAWSNFMIDWRVFLSFRPDFYND